MDKKTKLWLGVGVVGVGAYLLWKSKQNAASTVAPVAPAPAKFVGADSFASVGKNEKFTNYAGGVQSDRMMSANGFGSVGARQISQDGTLNGNTLTVKGGHAGVHGQGIFANKPFTATPSNLVGANGEKIFANQTGKFFQPRTAKYGSNQGVFAPSAIKSPVEKPMAVTQKAPINNLVGADGGFFQVADGFGK